MSATHHYRFHWHADGAPCDTIIDAPSYPLACYRLAAFHLDLWQEKGVPADFEIDLSKPEIVDVVDTEHSGVVSKATLSGTSGFVFLDDRPWPYLATDHYFGEWWLYYWRAPIKRFASLRKLTPADVERFRPLALPPEKAALYFPK